MLTLWLLSLPSWGVDLLAGDDPDFFVDLPERRLVIESPALPRPTEQAGLCTGTLVATPTGAAFAPADCAAEQVVSVSAAVAGWSVVLSTPAPPGSELLKVAWTFEPDEVRALASIPDQALTWALPDAWVRVSPTKRCRGEVRSWMAPVGDTHVRCGVELHIDRDGSARPGLVTDCPDQHHASAREVAVSRAPSWCIWGPDGWPQAYTVVESVWLETSRGPTP